jgi:hypothetical protein
MSTLQANKSEGSTISRKKTAAAIPAQSLEQALAELKLSPLSSGAAPQKSRPLPVKQLPASHYGGSI